MKEAIWRRRLLALEPSRSPCASEWKRQEPSPGCRITRAADERSTSTGPEPSASSFLPIAGLASGCFSRALRNHGQLAVSCGPSHLSHLSEDEPPPPFDSPPALSPPLPPHDGATRLEQLDEGSRSLEQLDEGSRSLELAPESEAADDAAIDGDDDASAVLPTPGALAPPTPEQQLPLLLLVLPPLLLLLPTPLPPAEPVRTARRPAIAPLPVVARE